jgi:preprotein translocase subunit YajC
MSYQWILPILAEAAPPAQAPARGGGLQDLIVPMGLVLMIFYFLVFRPEGKKRKERQRMISALKKGDSIMTTGGMLGKVWKVDDNEVVVRIDKDKDIKVHFAKHAILEVLKTEDGGDRGPSEQAVRQLEQQAKS